MKHGQYYYRPHRDMWGVYQHEDLGNGNASGVHVRDFQTMEEARREVFRLNGWNYKPKQ